MRAAIIGSLLAVTVFAGCVAEDPTVLIVKANQSVNRKAQCALKATGTAQEFRAFGVMDLLQTNRYVMFPLVENQLPKKGSAATGQYVMSLDSSTVTLQGAWFNYSIDGLEGPYDGSATETSLPSDVYIATAGSVEGDGGRITVALEAIPPSVGALLDRDKAFDDIYRGGVLSVEMVLQGFMADGTEVHTPPFVFPVTVCRGCLLTYPVAPKLCCPATVEITVSPCQPGQDEGTECPLACVILTSQLDRADKKMAMVLGYVSSLADSLSAEAQKAVDVAFGRLPPSAL